MTKTKTPVSSFGPELMTLLRRGASERIELKDLDGKLAVHLRLRIHQLRTAMRKENHPDADTVYRAKISILGPTLKPGVPDPSKKQTIVISPRDSEFNAALNDAGIKELTLPKVEAPKFAEPPAPVPIEKLDEAIEDDPALAFLRTLTPKA